MEMALKTGVEFLDNIDSSEEMVKITWELVRNEIKTFVRHTADQARYSDYSLQKEWMDERVDDIMFIIKNIQERGVE